MSSNNLVIIDNENTINISKMSPNEEHIITLNYEKCINDLYKSYKNKKTNVFSQFKKDFPRCFYAINNNIESDMNTFMNYFEFSYYKYNIKPYVIFMLCTQAIMGIVLQLLYKNIPKNKNLYIGELKKKTNLIFKFYTTHNNLFLKISKILRIFTINKNSKDVTLNKISINIFISLCEKDKIIITYKILKK